MQANTVEQIAEVQRKYEELQQQLRAEAAEREAAAAAREAEARAMVAEQSKKYDDLQLQLQQMMHMFQQSQKPPQFSRNRVSNRKSCPNYPETGSAIAKATLTFPKQG